MPDSIHRGHAAVNVKVPHLPDVPADEATRTSVYDSLVARFWAEAPLLAHNYGYAHIFAEGRSSGWCVPFYQTAADGRTQFDTWPGQGPEHGYPRYPDVAQASERNKFQAFERDILGLMESLKAEYVEQCQPILNQFSMRCPQCKRSDRIDVAATVWVRLTPDGTDADEAVDHDHEWEEDSRAVCRACDHEGTVGSFQTEEESPDA